VRPVADINVGVVKLALPVSVSQERSRALLPF
jgi:hypothetical protein